MDKGSVVVTGAANGIGRAIALDLAHSGYDVVAADLDERGLAAAFSPVQGVFPMVVDITDPDAPRRVVDAAQELSGLVGLVNNAARHPRRAPVHELDAEHLREILETDLLAPERLSREAIRAFLAAATPGRIVNVSSVHARTAVLGSAHYAMAKAALEALTRAVAIDYGRMGIRCNAVAPGFVLTETIDAAWRARGPEEHDRLVTSLASMHPPERVSRPEEVARVVTFLISEASSYVNGAVVPVDGGSSVMTKEPDQ